jgi:hypothetical protein
VIDGIVVPIDTRAEDYRLACITFYLEIVFPEIGFTRKYVNLLFIYFPISTKLRLLKVDRLWRVGGGGSVLTWDVCAFFGYVKIQ